MSRILLIGCGRMGGAMASAWVGGHEVFILDPHAELLEGAERAYPEMLGSLQPDAVVLAVKPQVFDAIHGHLVQLDERPVFISIMAGTTLTSLACALRGRTDIVRAMPNTPAAIGCGMTVACCLEGTSSEARALAEALLGVTGDLAWIEDEAMLDVVTAVSGSGPAYFFRFTEAIAAAGQSAGLPADLAMRLARQTFVGAAALARNNPAEPLSGLRASVTSPGGTTEAGLSVLDDGDILEVLARDCVTAAAARSRELGR